MAALAASATAWPLTAREQPPDPMPRIGVILQVPPSEAAVAPLWRALVEGLREYGWKEGKNLVIEGRYGGRDPAGFAAQAADLARLKVRAILAANPHSIAGARQATSTVPIIMLGGVNPIWVGWVKSVSNPEGNLTGLAADYAIFGKHIELLREISPTVTRIAVLYSPQSPVTTSTAKALLDEMAPRFGITVILAPVASPAELQASFATITREQAQALIVLGGDPVLQAARFEVADFAIRQRLPSVTGLKVLVPDGLLMSYAHDPVAAFRRAGWYVDRILKGARVADLPIEFLNQVELVINLKTATAIGLTVPPNVLARADEVIE
jgi:putative tryptophan/tyrosine transport system substrate-binding protein